MSIDWKSLTDQELETLAEQRAWSSIYNYSKMDHPSHEDSRAACTEAKRRGKPAIYERAQAKARACFSFNREASA